MEVKVIPFHPKHLEVMNIRDIDSAIFGDFKSQEAFDRVDQMSRISTQAGTFLCEGRIHFVAGFCPMWPGVYEVWMLPSVYVRNAPMFFCRTLRRYIDRIAHDFKAHRIQTTSFDDKFHERWMKFMGFEKEGTLRQFTQDKRNMCQFGRIF